MADLILEAGRVWNGEGLPFDGGVAVAGSRIVAVGQSSDLAPWRGPRTRVVNLGGRLVLPAFGDAHLHAVSGGLEGLRCDLSGLRTRAACLERVAAHVATLPPDAWVLGGGWAMEAFPGGTPLAADLDAVCQGRPAFLPNKDHHSAWVSSAALACAGLDRDSPDPPAGRIERDERGGPSGTLHESAMALVLRHVPVPSAQELAEGLRAALRTLHRVGITHFQDACVGEAPDIGVPDSFDTYRRAAEDGWLSAEVRGALWWDRSRGLEQIDDLLARRERCPEGPFAAHAVKIMVDGVCENFTAALASPYLGAAGHDNHRGHLFVEPELLTEAVARLDGLGFQVHFHTIGDRAVTTALDALESLAPERRGRGRHHLAHLQLVDPRDLPRFAQLGAVANFQPLWACHDPQMDELTVPVLGEERAGWQYSIGSLWASGATVAFGSDWPVSSPDPLQEMHVALTRTLSTRLGEAGTPETTDPLRADQAITLTQALTSFTQGPAFLNGAERHRGRLLEGWAADLVVLDQDLFAGPVTEVGQARVDMTIGAGAVLHGEE